MRTRWAETGGKRTYGEFDMGFVALLRSLEDELALLEQPATSTAAPRDGVFVDVGSGRANRVRPLRSSRESGNGASGWRLTTCTPAAEQVATRSPNEDVVLLDEFIEVFPSYRGGRWSEPAGFVVWVDA